MPDWGRFVIADVLIQNNLYCYCDNRPIIFSDASGFKPLLLTDVNKDTKRYRYSWDIENERLTAIVFAETLISIQASGEWRYSDTIVCQFGSVDCVGLYRYILLWYYKRPDYNSFLAIRNRSGKPLTDKNGVKKIANQVSQIVEYATTDLADINADYSNLEVGMGLFEYDPTKVNTRSKGWEHMGYYVGETEDGPHTVIHATSDGKISIDQIGDTDFNKCGYLAGIAY